MQVNKAGVLRFFSIGCAIVAAASFLAAAAHSSRISNSNSVAPARSPASASILSPAEAKIDKASIEKQVDALPLTFEPNIGQADASVQFISRASNYALALTQKGAAVSIDQASADDDPFLRKLDAKTRKRFQSRKMFRSPRFRRPHKAHTLAFTFDGASSAANPQPIDELATKSNYFIGNDPSKWHSGVPNYARVRYNGIYPGIDLVYYGNRRQLEFDFLVSPGANPTAIKLKVDPRDHVSIRQEGSLQIGAPEDGFQLHAPSLYQTVGNEKRAVHGQFALLPNNEVAIRVGAYDKTKPLVIDPSLGTSYSTYLTAVGGADTDAIAVDTLGDAFVVGTTFSSSFPIVNGYQTTAAAPANGIVYVSELNPLGTGLLYSTYLGGSGGDYSTGIAIDSSGGAYVAGYTFSTDFPVLNGLQTSTNNPAGANAFVARIDTTQTGTASLIYSTYLGGGGNATAVGLGDAASAIATDGTGLAYVTGLTMSDASVAAFPTTASAFQSTLGGPNGNAFLTAINTGLTGSSSLVYSTYLGGDAAGPLGDLGTGVAVDGSGNAYLVGQTTSDDGGPFPTTATAYQSVLNSANGNVFVAKIATTASGPASLVYSTYFGGSTSNPIGDYGAAIALDSTGGTYIAGDASSTDFPITSGVFQTTNSTNGKAFVAKMNLALSGTSSLVYSTFLGGTNGPSGDGATSIAVDSTDDAYIAGEATSTDFPTTTDAAQTTNPNTNAAAFFTELSPDATTLVFSTYLGGSCADEALGVSLDALADAYVAGYTCSSDFPVSVVAFDTTYQPNESGFVTKYAPSSTPNPTPRIRVRKR